MKNYQLDSNVSLYTAKQIRDVELSYAELFQQGTYSLMESAGDFAYQKLKHHWPHAKRILVLTGKGNNGGDGFVIARLATQQRKQVTLCHLADIEDISGDALIAYQNLPNSGITLKCWSDVALQSFDIIVDAMLGTGIKGAVRAPFTEVIAAVNSAKIPVLSIDIPSGIDANTGNCINCAIKADVTVTFVGHKQGLYTGSSANYRGRLYLSDLAIPSACYPSPDKTVRADNWASLRELLKPRQAASHKGCHGHCLVIGGTQGMTGAVIMAATAAARVGCGLTSAWLENGAASLLVSRPEVMALDVSFVQIEQQLENLKQVDSLVIGPGLGQNEWSKKWMQHLSNHALLSNKVKVWDADGLNWLAANPDFDDLRILTPHPGEAARLLGCSTEKINQGRYEASRAIAQKYGGICVLKGAGTVVSDAKGNQIVCAVGNPGMASGGMGDVLSGIIGSLLAQGFPLFDAATLGVCIHGEAADRAAGKQQLYRGMLAGDLFEYLVKLVNFND